MKKTREDFLRKDIQTYVKKFRLLTNYCTFTVLKYNYDESRNNQ